MMPGFLFAAEGKKVLKSVNDDIFRFVCIFLLLFSFFSQSPRRYYIEMSIAVGFESDGSFDCLPISNVSS